MNNFILLSFALALSATVRAQENTAKNIADDKPVRQVQSASAPIQMKEVNDNDEYFGRKQEFTRMFISNVLPDDFPKYKRGTDVDDYTSVVNAYLKLNANALTEKFKAKYEKK